MRESKPAHPVRTVFIGAGGQAGITTQDFFIFLTDLKKGTLLTTRVCQLVSFKPFVNVYTVVIA
jgi:hypothetical protein